MSFPALTASHITFTYPGAAEPVLHDVTVSFPPGWTAVMGDNGIGKSTLMDILRGALAPDSGQVSSGGAVISYCPQDVATAAQNIDDFANDWSPETLAIRDALGIGDDWPYRYDTLSGGERKRTQIACALAASPDVLILDEPTNHVDAPTRRAIARAMLAFTGQSHPDDESSGMGGASTHAMALGRMTSRSMASAAAPAREALPQPRRGRIGIVVSHDIALVDDVAMRCAFFERRHIGHDNVTVVTIRPGGYTQAHHDAAIAEAHDEAALEQARKEASRLQRESAMREHDAALAATAWRANRAIDRKDHDARNAAKLAKSTSVNGSAGASKARLDARVHAAQVTAESLVVAAKRYDGDLTAFSGVEPSHRTELVRIPAGLLPFGGGAENASESDGARREFQGTRSDADRRITAHAHREDSGVRIPLLSIGPTDHIGIIGPNGAGKTTLLSAVLRALESAQPDEPVLVIAQDTTDEDAAKAFSELSSLGKHDRTAVMSALAQLNADPDRMTSRTARLSPGELRKLLLCLGIVKKPHAIVMDEPTNHLDLHSSQALARALHAYRGAVLVVSHDMPFLDAAVTQLWSVDTD